MFDFIFDFLLVIVIVLIIDKFFLDHSIALRLCKWIRG